MSDLLSTSLPTICAGTRSRSSAAQAGLDFFPTVFEILTYDQMNEIAAYGGFPNRYPHWRFGMEYERLAKSYEYGLSKIYEMVINNNPSYAYLLEGNSLVDQKLVMAHVYGHVDFFKNNFCFRANRPRHRRTDGRSGRSARAPTTRTGAGSTRWPTMAPALRRIVARQGINKVEEFIDHCLSLENLLDLHAPFSGKRAKRARRRGRAQGDRESLASARRTTWSRFINPAEYLEEQRKKIESRAGEADASSPSTPSATCCSFLLDHAPLERWERDVLEVIREEATTSSPQWQTKIMNEGWATYWHSQAHDREDPRCERRSSTTPTTPPASCATSGGRLNPYKLGVELFRHIEERWDRGQFGKEWEECDDLDAKKNWNLRLGLGKKKIFEVRALYNDVTFIDEFLTPEFCASTSSSAFGWSNRNERYEIESREFKAVKEKLLFQLTNGGNPFIYVEDANYDNRGELLLRHDHQGLDLRQDYAKEVLRSLSACGSGR